MSSVNLPSAAKMPLSDPLRSESEGLISPTKLEGHGLISPTKVEGHGPYFPLPRLESQVWGSFLQFPHQGVIRLSKEIILL